MTHSLKVQLLKKLIKIGERPSQVNIHTSGYMLGFTDALFLTDKEAKAMIDIDMKKVPRNLMIEDVKKIMGIKIKSQQTKGVTNERPDHR